MSDDYARCPICEHASHAECVEEATRDLRAENVDLRAKAADAKAVAASALAEVARLKTELANARMLPNGWPQPTFLHRGADDGSLCIEWIDDERSVTFWWDPDPAEGVMALRTAGPLDGKVIQQCEEDPALVVDRLNEWLCTTGHRQID